MWRLARGVLVAVAFTGCPLVGNSQALDRSRAHGCTGVGCEALSRAELFMRAFASSKSVALRTSVLEQDEQVRLAFYGIDATRVEVESGRLGQHEGDFIIDGHERVIRNYVHDKANDAIVSAGSGQVSDIPAVRSALGGLLGIARQDALLGREKEASNAQAQMVKALTTFSEAFARTCEKQTYPIEVALELERQNEILGTGVSVIHCANRKLRADLTSQGVEYGFQGCADSYGYAEWTIRFSGRVTGSGQAINSGVGWSESTTTGRWEADIVYQGRQTMAVGDIEFSAEEIDEQDGAVLAPADAGPNAKLNGLPSAPVPERARWNAATLQSIRITTMLFAGSHGYWGWTSTPAPWGSGVQWVQAEIRREDMPCKLVSAP